MLTGFGCLVLYFFLAASAALLLRRFVTIPDEPFRKLLHMILLGSLFVFVFAFESWWTAALCALLFVVIVYPLLALAERIPGFSAFMQERKAGELKSSLILVFVMFAAVISVCWGLLHDRLLVLAVVLAWGPGDAAAALVGKRFGRHKIRIRQQYSKKSWEGSLSMFLSAFLCVLVVLLLRGTPHWAVCIPISLLTAAAAALTEFCSPGGRDTLYCPLASMVVLLPLLQLFGGLV